MVGKSGRIKAEIEVRDATIGGRVEGRVQARERVELETGSQFLGDVQAKTFMIQDGVFFQGNCSMGEAEVVPKAAQSARRSSFVGASRSSPVSRGTQSGAMRPAVQPISGHRLSSW